MEMVTGLHFSVFQLFFSCILSLCSQHNETDTPWFFIAMSYQQPPTMPEGTYSRSNGMYSQSASQARTHRESHGQNVAYPQGHINAPPVGDGPMGGMVTQFANLNIPGSNIATSNATITAGPGQVPVGHSYYYTQDGQVLFTAPGVYGPQSLTSNQLSDNAYGSYAAATVQYLPQPNYPGYVPGYQVMPYTPGRSGYPAGSDHLGKDVPGLDNRRGSYSTTNESAPGTPYYSTLGHRENGTHIATVDRSPIYSTPSPQQLPHAMIPGQIMKALPYAKGAIPHDIDMEALNLQHPAIPPAVPAVFTPKENMRTLEQSLSNPIYGNRNVYIRGLHPNTDDETLAAYAARFGRVETSKAIIDTSTGACKG
jgi:hypothetical protein